MKTNFNKLVGHIIGVVNTKNNEEITFVLEGCFYDNEKDMYDSDKKLYMVTAYQRNAYPQSLSFTYREIRRLLDMYVEEPVVFSINNYPFESWLRKELEEEFEELNKCECYL